MIATLLAPRRAALLVLVLAALTIGGALVFEHGLGYAPCKLCLTERRPYYVGMALALLAALLAGRSRGAARALLGLVALTFLVGAGLGVYHAGAEWGFWPGPSDCGGGTGAAPGDVGDFLRTLGTTHVTDCTQAAWRFLGLSLAGWNALIAAALALLAGLSAARWSEPGASEAEAASP